MQSLSIKSQLRLLSFSGIAGLVIFAALTFVTVQQIRVGSKFFEQKQTSNAVASDFENPPQSLQKVYSLAVEASDATSDADRNAFIAQIRDARKDYESGHIHYIQVVPPGPLHDWIAGESHAATEAWYQAAETSYFPALVSGDRAAADAARLGPMETAYRRDAHAVDEITRLTTDWNDANDRAAVQLVRSRTISMYITFGLILAALLFLGNRIIRQIASGLDHILEHLEAFAAYDLTRQVEVRGAIEFQRMLRAVGQTGESFREVLASIRKSAQSLLQKQ